MLAQQGWTVRVQERSPEIREVGTGIYIKNNAIEVLEEFGIFDRLASQGLKLERSQVLDRDGRIMQDRALVGRSRVHVFLRQTLIEVLREEVRQSVRAEWRWAPGPYNADSRSGGLPIRFPD